MSEVSRLIDRVIQSSGPGVGYDEEQRVIQELAALGSPALNPILRALGGPIPRDINARDAYERLMAVLCAMVRIDPDPLIEIVLGEATNPETQLYAVVEALGDSRTDRTIEALLVASRHRNSWVRLGAIGGLIRARDPRSIDPVILALRDRSPQVQYLAAEAMNTSATNFFRVPRALKNLRKLLESKGLEEKHPGTFREARGALEKIERGE